MQELIKIKKINYKLAKLFFETMVSLNWLHHEILTKKHSEIPGSQLPP
jgi:hypothetical protein